jgi:hypothetical protein
MMSMKGVLLSAAFAATVAVVAAPASASTNLLTNGSFETGDLTGWTIFGDFTFSGVGSTFGGTTGGITQTFIDTPGQTYVATGWYTGIGGAPSSLEISLNDTAIINLNPGPSSGVYTEFLYRFVGTGSDTVTVTSFQLPSYNLVDNFSVTAAPEPSTWAMMGLGFMGLAFAGYRTRRAATSIA